MEFLSIIIGAIIGAIIGDIIPVSFIIALIRFIHKKKLSKGWCILVFLFSTLCTFSIGLFFTGKAIPLGIFDYLIHTNLIAIFLYDKDAPSFFDTEKEILRKRKLKEKSIHEET